MSYRWPRGRDEGLLGRRLLLPYEQMTGFSHTQGPAVGGKRKHAAALFAAPLMLLVLAAVPGFLPLEAHGANPAAGLTIDPITAYNLVVDSNIESPAGRSPSAGYVGVKFCNDGTSDLNNVSVYIGNMASNTPGIYPVMYTNKPGPGLYPFSLTHEGGSAGTADATRYLGTIHPDECRAVYWLVSYPLKDSAGNAVHGPSVKPADDLQLFYDIWATARSGGTVVRFLGRSPTRFRAVPLDSPRNVPGESAITSENAGVFCKL